MENSLNSSSIEPTVSGLNLFKKPTDFYQAFEVSLEESIPETQSNKPEPELDISSGTQKLLPFKKCRKSFQHPFSVSLNESVLNSQSEQSVTLVKPHSAFKKKHKSLVDFFNVSFNETNISLQPDELRKSIDESNTVYHQENPFKKQHIGNDIMVGNVTSLHVSCDEGDKSTSESHRQLPHDINGDEADSATFLSKENPFKKACKQKRDSLIQFELSVANENESVENEMTEPKNKSNITSTSRLNTESDSSIMKTKLNPFKKTNKEKKDSLTHLELSVADENESKENKTAEQRNKCNMTNTSGLNTESDSSIMKTKLNPFEGKKSLQNYDSMISITEGRSNKSLESEVLTDPVQLPKNISLERNISKVTNNTASFFEQSSFNDENLNNWMSDHSDEEMPPPTIPSVTANLSPTKEKADVPNFATSDRTPLSIWEQKFHEIVSNVEKKCQAAKSNLNSDTYSKPKLFKKSEVNLEKPCDDTNKYKPPKLIKPASFITKKLYEYIIKRLEPKYGIDTMIESENLVLSICDTVKKVTRRKSHQKKLIENLKKEMAEAGLIETTMDFYEFIIKFLPYSFRVKVIPCLQPVTNVVYPPKDVLNPLDKIL